MSKRKTKRSKNRKASIFKPILLLGLLGSGFFLYQETNDRFIEKQISETENPVQSNRIPNEKPKETGVLASVKESVEEMNFGERASAPIIDIAGLRSTNAILIDRETGKVLVDKKSEEKIFPASLTKIMTVLLGIEQLGNLDQQTIMKEEYFEGLIEMDASVAGFQIGEKVSYRDILYGAILPSGADSCLAIAHLLYSSEELFVEQMNERAKELGLKNTHFSNTTGLHDPQNYSTVADIASLLEYALQNPEFSTIFGTRQFTTSPTNLSLDGLEMKSSMFKFTKDFPQLDSLLKGGKTGFTEEAGLCLASIAEINNKQYLLVTVGAPFEVEDEADEHLHIQDAASIYLQLVGN